MEYINLKGALPKLIEIWTDTTPFEQPIQIASLSDWKEWRDKLPSANIQVILVHEGTSDGLGRCTRVFIGGMDWYGYSLDKRNIVFAKEGELKPTDRGYFVPGTWMTDEAWIALEQYVIGQRYLPYG